MAPLCRECLLIIFLITMQVVNITSTCSKNCECKHEYKACVLCPYSIKLRDNVDKSNIEMCCHNNSKLFKWIQNNANKTFVEVVIEYNKTCNVKRVDFDFPLINTNSITITNSSATIIRINVKSNNVRKIDLSVNNLHSITKGLFNNYIDLRELLLSRNEIMTIEEDSFLGLSKLETLDLSGNHLTLLSNVFLPLKNLQYLNLSQNYIEYIHDDYFNNWLLQHLDISYNNLQYATPGALQQLPNLARLLLTDNPHLGITRLNTQLLVGTGRRLQQIDASRTGLCQVPEAFTHSVRFLSLVGNKITSIRCGDLDSYPLLQSLDFCDNKIISIEDDSLGRLEMLLFLNINKNQLTGIPRSLPDGLKYLSISDNLIGNLSVSDLKDLSNLRILLLKNNRINYVQDHVFNDLLSLEMLDLSNNPIKFLTSTTFDGPLSLRDLRLCHLNVSVPQKDGSFPLSSPESVQMLHLQSSPGLARQLLADSAALAAFSHLQYLDLRMNNLSEIRNDLIFYLGQLNTLRLHGNSINCSKELWLSDWMNSNKSFSQSETCYYSTVEAKTEMAKYNCTFPESFTISDSLPPVNLYSTEMINKLLRYYGYLNNKTERAFNKHKIIKSKNDSESFQKNVKEFDKIQSINTNYSKISRAENNNNNNDFNNNINQSTYIRTKNPLKSFNANRIRNHRLNIDRRFLDINQLTRFSTQSSKQDTDNGAKRPQNVKTSGKRLNTPISTIESALIIRTSENQITDDPPISEANTVNPNMKLEFSSYRETNIIYAQILGTIALLGLILISLALWLIIRRRYKRRQARALNLHMEDQIEVSNISGGVIW